MSYPLALVVAACGLNKPIILRAIKPGKAPNDQQAEWRVEPVVLRCYTPAVIRQTE
jgi:hypothetical protein